MLENIEFDEIQSALFKDRELNTYAVIDGAAVKVLRFKLWELQPEHCCLWAGKLAPDMEEVDPYLVKLERDSEFTHWLIKSGWGNNWNIFVNSANDLKGVRKHLRKFLMVEGPDGESQLFRFYDPRVLADFLKVIEPTQAKEFYQTDMAFFINISNTTKLKVYQSI